MEVVAVGSNISHRLGIVQPGMVGDFVLPQAMVGGGNGGTVRRADGRFPGLDPGRCFLSPGVVVGLRDQKTRSSTAQPAVRRVERSPC